MTFRPHDHAAALRQLARQADRMMLCVLWGLLLFSLALSGLHNTWHWAALVGVPAALLPTLSYRYAPGALLTRCLVAAAVMVFAALNIQQAAGMTELHFGIFVYLAFLLCYRDWRPIVVAAAVIALHHLGFDYLQQWGYGVICFTHPSLALVLVHAAYVVVETVVLVYLSVELAKAARQSVELECMVAALAAQDSRIDLRMTGAVAGSRIGRRLQEAIATLRSTVSSVRDGTDAIAAAAGEIAAGNAELSERTERQAISVEQTAQAMARLVDTVQRHTASATEAHGLALAASDVAVRGGVVVGQVVQTMDAINQSSRSIVDIIGVIDGIAFQTNILALNAAVEAARAGESGRGFAVVASEVRQLAQRSASAAADVKRQLGGTVEQLASGSTLVHVAGATMTELVDGVQRVTDIMAGMAAASREQNQGLAQINQAIKEFDQSTQKNAALVEEDAAASESLQQEAQQLAVLVSAFRLDADDTPSTLASEPQVDTRGYNQGANGARSMPALTYQALRVKS